MINLDKVSKVYSATEVETLAPTVRELWLVHTGKRSDVRQRKS